MTTHDKYDNLFEETAPTDRIFVDKGVLNPLSEPTEIVAREDQEREIATLLNGIQEGYLPTTVSVYGPPGTGKTLTTRRVCSEFATRNAAVAVEYVNLKQCRTLFSAANEILFELTGAKKQAYEGIDGVFTGIWDTLEGGPEWTILLLDEIDHIQQDSNYDPNDFFYRLLRGEGKLKREINLSVWLLSNELFEVNLRLDSRVQSAMSDEEVFFPPYSSESLAAILEPRIEQAFHDGAMPEEVFEYGVQEAARWWGDARKALTLFRQAGETAAEQELEAVTTDCIDANLETTDKEVVREKLLQLPLNHFVVLTGITSLTDPWSGEIIQPVTTAEIYKAVKDQDVKELYLSERTIRDIVGDLETMGIVETWVESKGSEGRVKQIKTTFEPQWVHELLRTYAESSEQLTTLIPE